ncbi:hypothetical protein NMY22_g3141 [Coprinellus aureogranulatus]|nr:hypothetical protein NMY22_g3141 [Coprinellus aureogranulatus]
MKSAFRTSTATIKNSIPSVAAAFHRNFRGLPKGGRLRGGPGGDREGRKGRRVACSLIHVLREELDLVEIIEAGFTHGEQRLTIRRFADGHLPVHISTIHRALRRAGLSLKRVQKLAKERDPFKRADFVRRIGQYNPLCIVSIDEVSKDDRTYARLWGRAVKGARVEQYDPFVRGKRYSMCAAMALDKGIVAARVLEGSFTHQTFYEYVRDDVLPVMNPYPGPRSVLLLDNARIHHSDDIQALVRSAGCRIEFLPPYSPDYQPVEQAFSAIKSHLRRQGLGWYSHETHRYELYEACTVIRPEMTWGFFRHAGYL